MNYNPHLDELTARFSELDIRALSGYGANIYLDGLVVTIYWGKKNRYGFSNGKWFNYSTLEDVYTVIDGLIKPKQQVIKDEPIANGTEKCIEHIIKKIEYGKKNNMPNTNIAMMQTLCEELKQYL